MPDPTILTPPKVRVEPDTTSEPQTETFTPEDWVCAMCMNPVTSEDARCFYNDVNQFEFTNPAGRYFQLVLFSRADGCQPISPPTTDHSWFPGYAWSVCMCRRCGIHLGWKYIGHRTFFGLIRDAIVRGYSMVN